MAETSRIEPGPRDLQSRVAGRDTGVPQTRADSHGSAIDQSPRMVAQRHAIAAAFGPVAQRSIILQDEGDCTPEELLERVLNSRDGKEAAKKADVAGILAEIDKYDEIYSGFNALATEVLRRAKDKDKFVLIARARQYYPPLHVLYEFEFGSSGINEIYYKLILYQDIFKDKLAGEIVALANMLMEATHVATGGVEKLLKQLTLPWGTAQAKKEQIEKGLAPTIRGIHSELNALAFIKPEYLAAGEKVHGGINIRDKTASDKKQSRIGELENKVHVARMEKLGIDATIDDAPESDYLSDDEAEELETLREEAAGNQGQDVDVSFVDKNGTLHLIESASTVSGLQFKLQKGSESGDSQKQRHLDLQRNPDKVSRHEGPKQDAKKLPFAKPVTKVVFTYFIGSAQDWTHLVSHQGGFMIKELIDAGAYLNLAGTMLSPGDLIALNGGVSKVFDELDTLIQETGLPKWVRGKAGDVAPPQYVTHGIGVLPLVMKSIVSELRAEKLEMLRSAYGKLSSSNMKEALNGLI